MNTAKSDKQLSVEKITEKINNYLTTIHAIQAFIWLVTRDEGSNDQLLESKYSIGRKMDLVHSIIPNQKKTVIPDAVIQRSQDIGYVVEAKRTLPNNYDHWIRSIKQLYNYSENLIGWWTKNSEIYKSCTVLLIKIGLAVRYTDYIDDIINTKNRKFRNPTSVVEFAQLNQVNDTIFLRLQWGLIEDTKLKETLIYGKHVSREIVISTFGEKKFYDDPPETEHIMETLWQHIFAELKSTVNYDNNLRAYPLEVDLNELTHGLQKLYGSVGQEPRSIEYPRKVWVRDAMEAFVKINLALPSKNGDDFTILFKRIQGNIIKRFSKHRRQTKKLPEQLTLL